MKKAKTLVLIVCCLSLFMASGCGFIMDLFKSKGQELASPPETLFQEGIEQLRSENYKTAAETFRKVKDRYPFSKVAIMAEIKMADAYYLEEQYLEALDAYQEFERLHPNNEAVPYVIYQQGMCHYEMMNGHQRDQRHTAEAIRTFYRLKELYPNTTYAAKAEGRLAECKSNLAGHEFYVGEFYYRMEEYKAALGRFVSLLRLYPDSGYHARALDYIRVCREKIAEERAEAAKRGEPEEGIEDEYDNTPMDTSNDEVLRDAIKAPERTMDRSPAPLTGSEP